MTRDRGRKAPNVRFFRLTDEQDRLLAQTAAAEGSTISDWARAAIIARLNFETEEKILTKERRAAAKGQARDSPKLVGLGLDYVAWSKQKPPAPPAAPAAVAPPPPDVPVAAAPSPPAPQIDQLLAECGRLVEFITEWSGNLPTAPAEPAHPPDLKKYLGGK